MPVIEIHSTEEYITALSVPNKLIVIDFTASWCGPCKQIAPFVETLSNKYPNVSFLKVDVDELADVASQNGITAMPTFGFYRDATLITKLTGANPTQLENLVKQHSEGGVASASATPAEKFDLPAGQKDISHLVDDSQLLCMNSSDNHTVKSIFQANDSYLESDTDEQLLIYIPFKSPIKIHSLKFDAPSDGRAPKTVRLFINEPTLGFDTATSKPSAQDVVLTATDLAPGKLTALKLVKFQKVNALTLFIKDNQGGKETSVLNRFRIFGEAKDTMDVSALKKDPSSASHMY